uniref:Uncharacterized protein n=1 Tax=Moniliophthora roreri TaxID=221103 RepID=A0A0W0F2G7_MONRR
MSSLPATPALSIDIYRSHARQPPLPAMDPFSHPDPTRVVRFDSECVLIPECQRYKRSLMITKSYSLPLWKKKAGERDEVQENPGAVVLKLPLPSFMAKSTTRSPSRGRECSRPPCLVNGNISASPLRQRASSMTSQSPNALPNPILVVDSHLHSHLHPPASPTLSSDGASSDTRSPINRSPTVTFNAPSYLSHSHSPNAALSDVSLLSSSPSANSTPINNINSNGKDRDKEPKVVTVPLRACCPDCFHITEECSRTGDKWEERFSKGARRRRGSSVSSSSGASVTSEEGGDQETTMYSPMAHYQPLDLAAWNASNAVDATKSNPNSNPNSAASTSAVKLDGGDEDEPDVEVSTFVTEVTVDDVESIRKRKGKFKSWEPLLRSEGDFVETEEGLEEGTGTRTPREWEQERAREVSTSSTSTYSSISAASSTSATSYNSVSSPDVTTTINTKDLYGAGFPLPRSHSAPSTPTITSAVPSTFVIPPPASYPHVKSTSSRSKKAGGRKQLRSLRRGDDDDDINLLFPLPSPKRSPGSSPSNTPGSQTPMNGSKTPSPNPSPMSSSSEVQLQVPPKRSREKSKLGLNCEQISPTSSSSSGSMEPETPVDATAEMVLPESLTKKAPKGHERVPSLKAAAEVAAAELQLQREGGKGKKVDTEAEDGGEGEGEGEGDENTAVPPTPANESEWIRVDTRNSKARQRETVSVGHGEPSVSSTANPSSPIPSSSTQKQTHEHLHGSHSISEHSTSSTPPRPKPRRRSSLRVGAGALLRASADMFRAVGSVG